MPFDGIVTKAVADELNQTIAGGRINKIYQPERDTLLLHIRAGNQNVKLLLCSNANSARVHLTDMNYENPSSPPMFCMLLRKHLSGGKITGVDFHDYERVLDLNVEAVDELGDRNIKKLVIEIMGRHSNIILLNSGGKIIDAIKHVDQDINRVREIMPARTYSPPPSQNKTSPAKLDVDTFIRTTLKKERALAKILLSEILGFSPTLCREICHRSGIDPDIPAQSLDSSCLTKLSNTIQYLIHSWMKGNYSPCIVYDRDLGKPLDFHAINLTQYGSYETCSSISEAIDSFYKAREMKKHIRNKSSNLIRIVKQNIERCEKKIQIHIQTREENACLENYRLFGELITANIHHLHEGMQRCSLLNYYEPEETYVEIPLDENRSPQKNAQWYFKKYTKAKTAIANAKKQLKLSRRELEYLENVLFSLEEAESVESIEEIREELRTQGYIRKMNKKKRYATPSTPLSFVSGEGYSIWVGRNNFQNDELTLKFAKPGDMWLHTKNIPGSHVIARIPEPIPDKTLLEAAGLAAWFSKARNASRVEVDYTRVKHVKKPSGAKPGMVIYFHYNTVIVDPKKPENMEKT